MALPVSLAIEAVNIILDAFALFRPFVHGIGSLWILFRFRVCVVVFVVESIFGFVYRRESSCDFHGQP